MSCAPQRARPPRSGRGEVWRNGGGLSLPAPRQLREDADDTDVDCRRGRRLRRGRSTPQAEPHASEPGFGRANGIGAEPVVDIRGIRGRHPEQLAGVGEDAGVGLGDADLAGGDDVLQSRAQPGSSSDWHRANSARSSAAAMAPPWERRWAGIPAATASECWNSVSSRSKRITLVAIMPASRAWVRGRRYGAARPASSSDATRRGRRCATAPRP